MISELNLFRFKLLYILKISQLLRQVQELYTVPELVEGSDRSKTNDSRLNYLSTQFVIIIKKTIRLAKSQSDCYIIRVCNKLVEFEMFSILGFLTHIIIILESTKAIQLPK